MNSATPTIFVGIPTMNRPRFVKDAIESVLAQTFQDFRCIISDNNSDPELAEQVKDFVHSLNDPRFSFYAQAVNVGENGQCNWFLDQCNECYFLFLHDDDRLDSKLIETALEVLTSKPAVDFYTSNQYLFNENGMVLETMTKRYNKGLMRDNLPDGVVSNALERELLRGVFGLSGTVFRTSGLQECGLDDASDSFPFDFNVMIRQLERNQIPWWDNRKLVGYRWHAGQASKQTCWDYNEAHILGYLKILETRRYTGKSEKIRRRLLAFSFRRYGIILYAAGQWLNGHRALKEGVKLDPSNPSAWIYLCFATFCAPLVKYLWSKKITFKEDSR
ncbi:MAG: glycosyltransferase involved in cell wall biosynthesis [Candidatus Azotimanducaceae bacterium]|jgi:glycosyltransferase involved in cell wall biosynthesis